VGEIARDLAVLHNDLKAAPELLCALALETLHDMGSCW